MRANALPVAADGTVRTRVTASRIVIMAMVVIVVVMAVIAVVIVMAVVVIGVG
jgi:hypothetical protein